MEITNEKTIDEIHQELIAIKDIDEQYFADLYNSAHQNFVKKFTKHSEYFIKFNLNDLIKSSKLIGKKGVINIYDKRESVEYVIKKIITKTFSKKKAFPYIELLLELNPNNSSPFTIPLKLILYLEYDNNKAFKLKLGRIQAPTTSNKIYSLFSTNSDYFQEFDNFISTIDNELNNSEVSKSKFPQFKFLNQSYNQLLHIEKTRTDTFLLIHGYNSSRLRGGKSRLILNKLKNENQTIFLANHLIISELKKELVKNSIEIPINKLTPFTSKQFKKNTFIWGKGIRREVYKPRKNCYFFESSFEIRLFDSSGSFGIGSAVTRINPRITGYLQVSKKGKNLFFKPKILDIDLSKGKYDHNKFIQKVTNPAVWIKGMINWFLDENNKIDLRKKSVKKKTRAGIKNVFRKIENGISYNVSSKKISEVEVLNEGLKINFNL